MIYLNQQVANEPAATCTRNSTLTGTTYYLWSMTHKLSGQRKQFIPYRIPPVVSYEPYYDLFGVVVSNTSPESLTGNTTPTECVVDLICGEWYLKIYEQLSPTNLNPSLAYNVVQETIVTVNCYEQNTPVSYDDQDDVFIIYNPDNE